MRKQSFNKNTKILIIGFGSIGQRHHKNLTALGYRNIYAHDTDSEKIKNQKSKIKNLDQETLKRFDVVFVCSPNHLHVEHALLAARAGCHLFIEKPLSHSLEGIVELQKIIKHKKLLNMVACNMRFHPCLRFIKNYLDHGRLGRVYSILHEFGHFLPLWRKGVDYRKIYAAKQVTGGGIILDDIHEFDLLLWLNNFAKIKKASWVAGKVSKLAIETEDIAVAVFAFANGSIGLVKTDYLQQRYCRTCEVVGERGTLRWDYNENIVWLENNRGGKKLFRVKNYDINEFYLEELKYFLDCVAKRRKTFNDVVRASQTLAAVLRRKL